MRTKLVTPREAAEVDLGEADLVATEAPVIIEVAFTTNEEEVEVILKGVEALIVEDEATVEVNPRETKVSTQWIMKRTTTLAMTAKMGTTVMATTRIMETMHRNDMRWIGWR